MMQGNVIAMTTHGTGGVGFDQFETIPGSMIGIKAVKWGSSGKRGNGTNDS